METSHVIAIEKDTVDKLERIHAYNSIMDIVGTIYEWRESPVVELGMPISIL